MGRHRGKDGGFLPPSGLLANDKGTKTASPALPLPSPFLSVGVRRERADLLNII